MRCVLHTGADKASVQSQQLIRGEKLKIMLCMKKVMCFKLIVMKSFMAFPTNTKYGIPQISCFFMLKMLSKFSLEKDKAVYYIEKYTMLYRVTDSCNII